MKRGFTVIEILLASLIMFLVGTGVYKTFCSGISLWKIVGSNVPRQDIDIFFSKIGLDLKNSFSFSETDFKCFPTQMSFFVHDTDYLFMSEEEVKSLAQVKEPIYKVTYIFKPGESKLHRRIYKFGSGMVTKDLVVLSGVEDVRFYFYVFDDLKKKWVKKKSLKDKTPQAVEIQVTFRSRKNRKRILHRIIEIPIVG